MNMVVFEYSGSYTTRVNFAILKLPKLFSFPCDLCSALVWYDKMGKISVFANILDNMHNAGL